MKAVFVALSAVVLLAALAIDDLRADPSVGGAGDVSGAALDADITAEVVEADIDLQLDALETKDDSDDADEGEGSAGTEPLFTGVDSAPVFVPLDAYSANAGNVRIEAGTVNVIGGSSLSSQSVAGGP